jgi:DNA-binding NtrC family response regulator
MKILVVDDDAGTLNAIKVSLMSVGYEIVTARDGETALKILEKAQRNAETVDLLLTDLRMPGMSGLELIQSARKLLPGIPSIIITAYGDDNILKDVEALKNCVYLDKPFRPETLIRLIEREFPVERDPCSIAGQEMHSF